MSERKVDIEEERQWLAAWLGGDRRAGDQLFGRYQGALAMFFVRREPVFAQELTSRALEELVTSLPTYRGDGSVRSFIFGVAYRVWCRHRRERWFAQRRERRLRDWTEFSELGAGDPQPFLYVEARERASRLRQCIDKLSHNARVILQLRFWEELREPEIQQLLNLRTREAASGRLRLTREKLRQEWMKVCEPPEFGPPWMEVA